MRWKTPHSGRATSGEKESQGGGKLRLTVGLQGDQCGERA